MTSNTSFARRRATVLLVAALLQGCATMPTPRNHQGSGYQPAQNLTAQAPSARCQPATIPEAVRALGELPTRQLESYAAPLGPGDRLQLAVSGDRDILSGSYVIASDGQLSLPGVVAMTVAGEDLATAESMLRDQLVAHGLVRAVPGGVRLTLLEAGGAAVSVEGAVFEPGLVRAGERTAEARGTTVAHAASGDFNAGRTLFAALRAAGGIRPDAAAEQVYLIRGAKYAVIDVARALHGGAIVDPQLASGDRVVVPSTGCFRPDLVRASPVTAPGVRVFMSNLTRPAPSNAQSAIGKESTSLPYGARLLQGVVSANCVGGSAMNAGRSAVLISRNPLTGQTEVVSRSIEALVRQADRDGMNPYLMPGDAIACYDSTAMSLSDLLGLAGSLIAPALLVKGID